MGNLDHSFSKQKADAVQLRTQAFINGKYVDAVSGKTFDCINPAAMFWQWYGEAIDNIAKRLSR